MTADGMRCNNLRLMLISDVKDGMTLGRSVYNANNKVILNSGVKLSNSIIRKLGDLGFSKIYIEDEETYGIEIQEMIPEAIKRQNVKEVKQVFDQLFTQSTKTINLKYKGIASKFESIFKELYSYLRDNGDLVITLSDFFSMESYLFTHSINVGIYSVILAILDNKRDTYTKDIGVGAMLHDVGLLSVDKKILDKKGNLTDEEKQIIDDHCKSGFDIIRQQGMSSVSAHCAYQHHERFDGSGYPRKLRGKDEINEVGRILAVADVFDALTSDRPYRPAHLPNEALEYLFAHTGSHFDPYFVNLFARHVNIYPVGMPVVLSNGDKGVISNIHANNLQRPVVLVLEHENRSVSPYELDLEQNLNVTVVECNLNAHKKLG